jgi:hypothetical protein
MVTTEPPAEEGRRAGDIASAVVVSQRLTIHGKTSWYSWLLTGLDCLREGEPA